MGETEAPPRFRLLGPLRVLAPDGAAVALGGRKPRELLAMLLLHPNQVLSRERLVDALWGESASDGATITLRTHVSTVRRVLAEAGTPDALAFRSDGYVLAVASGDLDSEAAERLIEKGQEALGLGDNERATTLLGRALDLWDGDPLSDLGPADFAATTIARLDELRLVAHEAQLSAELELGRHQETLHRLQALVARHPFRERFVAQLMVALYRAGRQADALATYTTTKRLLADELGLDPGPELQALETAMLRQDPLLLGSGPDPAPERRTASRRRASNQLPDAVLTSLRRTPIVGRRVELRTLDERWRTVVGGAAAVALLSGPAGVGKSRLIAELAHLASDDDATVIVARCEDASLAYQPLATALRGGDEVAEVLHQAPQPMRQRLAPLLLDEPGASDEVPETGRHAALLRAVDWLLTELAEGAPVLLVVEEAERIDPATAGLLRHVGRHLPARSMLVIAYRDPPGSKHPPLLELVGDGGIGVLADRLALRPLEHDDLADLVSELTGAAPSAPFVDHLWTRTGGNPFFATEVLRDLTPAVVSSTDDVEVPVPNAVRDVLRHRLATLAQDAQEAVAAAAVLGADVELRLLARLLELPEERVVTTLEPAVARGFLVESGRSWAGSYAFPHDLMREAVYAETPPPSRDALHRRTADLLLAAPTPLPADVMAAAVHLRQAGGAADPYEVGQASLRAAEAAAQRLAWTEAVQHAEAALPFIDRGAAPAEQAEARVSVALLRLRSGLDHARAVALLEDALRRQQLGDTSAAGTTHSRIGGALCLHHTVMDIPRALDHFDAAERLRPEIADRFHLHMGRMQAAMFGAHLDVLGPSARRAEDLARRSGRADLLSYAAWGSGYHAANLGEPELAFEHFASSWQAAHSLGDASVGWLPANAAAHVAAELYLDPATGRAWCRKGLAQPRIAAFAFPHEAVADQLARSMAVMGELTDAFRAVDSLPAGALAHRVLDFYRGEWERAADNAAQDVASNRASGNRHEVLFHSRRLADAFTVLEENDRAVGVLEEALAIAVAAPQVPSEVWVRARLAQLFTDDPAAAQAHLARCDEVVTHDGWAGLRGEVALARAMVAARTGARTEAEAAFHESVDLFTRFRLPWRQADAHLAWARLLDQPEQRDAARAVYAHVGAAERWALRCDASAGSTRSQRAARMVGP